MWQIGQLAAGYGVGVAGQGHKAAQIFHQAPQTAHGFVAQNRQHQTDDADDHHGALNEIRVGRGHHAAGHQVDGGEGGDDQHPHPGGYPGEDGAEEGAQALVDRRGVGNQENEDDDGGQDLHAPGVVAFLKVVGHGPGTQNPGHDPGAVGEKQPGQQAAQHRVADADPDSADADVPAVLARVTDEHHRGKIGGAVRESGDPCADFSAAQQEGVQGSGFAEADAADEGHGNGIDGQRDDGVKLGGGHGGFLLSCA